MAKENQELVDLGDYPWIFLDGIGDIEIAGNTARMRPFMWRKIDGIWRPVVGLGIVQPLENLSRDAFERMHAALAKPPEHVRNLN